MKYPQFVSTRAINAISDWLVSQLEQLGVEAPLIYSRLLLSLLHTPLQINALDLAELSQIKQQSIFGRNNNCRDYKSGRRVTRLTESETLKRLAAIESLVDVVSTADQNVSKIEELVDQLTDKLRAVEAQTSQEEIGMKPTRVEQIKKSQSASPDDPVNRYYRAFPALSKELARERTVSKSLTWPKNQNRLNQSSKIVNVVVSSGGKIKEDMNRNPAGVINRRGRPGARRRRQSSKSKMLGASTGLGRHNKSVNTLSGSSSSSSISSMGLVQHQNAPIIQTALANAAAANAGGNRMRRTKNSHAPWDTDFDGQWEMGEDLIQEFIIDQNKRNRSVSEGHCCNNKANEEDEDSNHAAYLIIDDVDEEHSSLHIENLLDLNKEQKYMVKLAELTGDEANEMGTYVDSLLMRDEDHFYDCDGGITPDTLSSVNSSQRRLYEREVSPEFAQNVEPLQSCDTEEKLFEAKFNKSVEALWNNNEKPGEPLKTEDGFWNHYYKHCYDIDEMEAFKQGVRQQYSGSGLQLTSTIWSESAMPVKTNEEQEGALKRSSFWEKTTAANTAAAFAAAPLEENKKPFAIGGYKKEAAGNYFSGNVTSLGYEPAYNMPNAAKWSECSFEAPFVSNNYKQSDYSEYKSLPMQSSRFERDDRVYQSMFDELEKRSELYPPISLANHSQFGSAFLRVRPALVKRGVQLEEPAATEPEKANEEEEENLLTAPRTHFKIIKQTYPNGYVFNIPGYWDDVEYQRLEDGSLVHNGKKYKEYLPSVANSRSSGLVLKYAVVEPTHGSSQTEYEIGRILMGSRIVGAQSRSINSPSHPERLNIFTNMMARDKALDIELDADLDDEDDTSFLNECTLNVEAWRRDGLKRKCLNNNNVHTLWENCSTCNNEIKSLPANPKMIDELDAEADEIMSDLKHLQDLYIGSNVWDNPEDADVDVQEPFVVRTSGEMRQQTIRENNIFGAALLEDCNEEGCYNFNKLISDLLKPETAMSLAQVLGDGQHEGILKGISHLNASDIDMVSAADNFENEKTIWKSWHNMQADDVQTLAHTEPQPQPPPATVSMAGSSAVVASDNKYVGGLWTNTHENNIWRKSGATKYNAQDHQLTYIGQQPHQPEPVPLPNASQQTTKRLLFTDRTLESNNNDATSIDHNKHADTLLWEHSYLEQIWNNEHDKQPAPATAVESMEEKLRTAWDKIENVNVAQPIATSSSSSSTSLQPLMRFNNNYGGNFAGGKEGKVSRHDRKRRHSASQNLLGAFNAAAAAEDAATVRRIDRVNSLMAAGSVCENDELVNVVVTYNYLANINAALVANIVEQEVEVPLLASANPAVILNQVAIGARPLTR